MNNRALVLGANGRQGPAVVWALNKFGYYVEAVDTNFNNHTWSSIKDTGRINGTSIIANIQKKGKLNNLLEPTQSGNLKYSLVFSCLPYHLNYQIAEACLHYGLDYFDLGGNIEASKKIKNLIQGVCCSRFMTDLGLAPGLINILAQNMMEQNKLQGYPDDIFHTIEMYCGGLPNRDSNNMGVLSYFLSFSTDGLIKEYFDTCEVLENEEIKEVQPMGDVEKIKIIDEEFTAFNTSGGAHTTLEYAKTLDIKNCFYKTLRMGVHAEIITFLKYNMQLSNIKIREIIEKNCLLAENNNDRVIILIKGKTNKSNKETNLVINNSEIFTAMQKATGFSAAAIAHCVVKSGKLPYKDNTPEAGYINYEDIDIYNLFYYLKDILPEITGVNTWA